MEPKFDDDIKVAKCMEIAEDLLTDALYHKARFERFIVQIFTLHILL